MRQESPLPQPLSRKRERGAVRVAWRSRVGCALRTANWSQGAHGLGGPAAPYESIQRVARMKSGNQELSIPRISSGLRFFIALRIVGSMQRFDPQAIGAAGLAEGFAGGDHHGFATLGQALSLGRFPGRCW